MDKSNFNLEYFVNLYVDTALDYVETAFKIAKKYPLLEEFDKDIRKTLSEKLNISVQKIGWLHHPFHWAFFCDKKDSPFELKENWIVSLKNEKNSKQSLGNYILTEYGKLLEEKIKANL
ncbi:hypothetical protein KAJ87_02435 [Candidatus Pacearchaeota archaeon]|nr:hypothetical protein [Candidatus Pacearchaeota archaeon]